MDIRCCIYLCKCVKQTKHVIVRHLLVLDHMHLSSPVLHDECLVLLLVLLHLLPRLLNINAIGQIED